MPGETDLHKTLKKQACYWLFRSGYRCIAAEVRLPPLGIIDTVGTGQFRAYNNYLSVGRELSQVCFIECKATRADFLRDSGDQAQLSLWLDQCNQFKSKSPRPHRKKVRIFHQLGKFRSCLAKPMANIHYVLAPTGIIQKKDLPPRWGLLALGEGGISVVVRADWQETARPEFVESAIARTLTADIYRADSRAMNSINREIFAQQQTLAGKIRNLKPQIVLAPAKIETEAKVTT